jgi:hypothetical protein
MRVVPRVAVALVASAIIRLCVGVPLILGPPVHFGVTTMGPHQ